MINLIFFDDIGSDNFKPLTDFRSPAEFLSGTMSLITKIRELLNVNNVSIFTEKSKQPLLKAKGFGTSISDSIKFLLNNPDSSEKIIEFYFINSRLIINKASLGFIMDSVQDLAYVENNKSAIIKVSIDLSKIKADSSNSDTVCKAIEDALFQKILVTEIEKYPNFDISKLKSLEVNQKILIDYTWEYILQNGDAIQTDYNLFFENRSIENSTEIDGFKGINLIKPEKIFIGLNTEIEPGTIISASNGPVIIDDNVVIMANTVIYGPAYIGTGTTIKAGSIIYGETSIGQVCKIGGEVAESIIQGYSNKQHHGFLGHAYAGEWVNLGAGTSNSDLKNNYSDIKVWVNGTVINSRNKFIGLTIGDHSKAAINTVFNTGTVAGSFVNVFTPGKFPPKYIPSFSWGDEKYDLSRAIQTAKAVMLRRGIIMTDEYEKRITSIYS